MTQELFKYDDAAPLDDDDPLGPLPADTIDSDDV